MAKILVIGNYKGDFQESMQRYTTWLASMLQLGKHQVTIVLPLVIFGNLCRGRGRSNKWLAYVDKYLLFPWYLFAVTYRYDYVHIADHSNSIYRPFIRSLLRGITCHDVLAIRAGLGQIPELKTGKFGRTLQRTILYWLARSDNIVFVSEETRQQFLNISPNFAGSHWVIDNPLHWNYKTLTETEAINILSKSSVVIPDNFFLHVGGNQWYKNRKGVIEIFSELRKYPDFANFVLILAGKALDEACKTAALFLPTNSILVLQDVSNDVLNSLYSRASALLFPSLAEGFGWPIAEAQSCDCLVVTSDREPMKSVAGAGAIFIDPTNSVEAASCVVRQWKNGLELIRLGRINAKRFDPQLASEKYQRMIDDILS